MDFVEPQTKRLSSELNISSLSSPMDETTPRKEEECRRRRNGTAICRETRDHVHYPPKRRTRSTRPRHAPSLNIESIFRVTGKARYGECRKNQAADIGTTAYDGCGEFVSAEDSINCAACGCHRSFHEEDAVTENVLDMLKISSHQFRKIFCSPYGQGKKKESSVGDRSCGGDIVEEKEVGRVKRSKTNFTAEQTEKMRNYAEKLRWKVRPESREEVDEFCVEIGVKYKKFRIWMNNHKDKN